MMVVVEVVSERRFRSVSEAPRHLVKWRVKGWAALTILLSACHLCAP